MSNRSFIDRAAEERRQCFVVSWVILPGVRLVGGLKLIEHGAQDGVGLGGLALPLHRVEIVHIGLVGLFIVAEQTHQTSLRARVYSTTFGTTKKWFSVTGAFPTISSAISPSLTRSGRFFISIGITDVIGSTPSTLTSDNCSTKASIAFNSPCRCGTSDSATAICARWA